MDDGQRPLSVAILIPCYQGRRPLLERSLWLLQHQTWKGDLSIWLIDDGSDEHLASIQGVQYLQLRNPGAAPRSSNTAYRAGYAACGADFVILTHPEYMVPHSSVQVLLDTHARHRRRVGHSAVALPRWATLSLDAWDWRASTDQLDSIANLWVERTPWMWSNQEAMSWCHHFAFSGQMRAGWDRFDFLPDTEKRGVNDSWLLPLETEAGIPPICSGLKAYHQWHERIENGLPGPRSVQVDRMVT